MPTTKPTTTTPPPKHHQNIYTDVHHNNSTWRHTFVGVPKLLQKPPFPTTPIPLNDNLVLMYSLSNFTYNQNFFKSKYLQHIEYIGLIAGKEVHYHMNITKHIRLYILYKNFCFIPSCLDWICLWFYHFSKSFSKFPLEEADEGNLMIYN